MDFGSMLGESFAYAKDAVVGKWMQWLLLLIATIILCIPLLGYSLKVLRGEKPAPEVTGWGTLIIDGIKYLIISLIYAIPALIVFFITVGAGAMTMIGTNPSQLADAIGGMALGFIIFVIVAIITGLFATIGIIRFARSGSMGEAFNFSQISATIGKIGWGTYIIALIIMGVIVGIVQVICNLIPAIGSLILFILMPVIVLFESRYLCILYDSAGAA
jgi:hypothetical protein